MNDTLRKAFKSIYGYSIKDAKKMIKQMRKESDIDKENTKLIKSITAHDVVQYIIESNGSRSEENPNPLGLQRILYFLQRDWIKKTGKPMFEDDFIAAEFGPRTNKVHYTYQIHGPNPIWGWFENTSKLPEKMKSFIDSRLKQYRPISYWDLVSKNTKISEAWERVWNRGRGKGKIISKNMIRRDKIQKEDLIEDRNDRRSFISILRDGIRRLLFICMEDD